jgi:SAM-dependent methyltransferase
MPEIARYDIFHRMLSDLGTPLGPATKLLDLGCGEGNLVGAALSHGLDAYGCDLYDVKYSWDWDAPGVRSELRAANRVRAILRPYRLPFDDSSMDVVISDQVFEHVLDYPQTIAELHRVMRPGAVFLHSFPSRYRWHEGHIFVPLSSMFRPRWWLWLWASLGIRNEYQGGMSVAEVVHSNAHFLEYGTHYLPPGRIKREFGRYFSCVEFVERVFLPYSNRPRLLCHIPGGPTLYGLLWNRFLYGMRTPGTPNSRARSIARAPSIEVDAAF